eukprot:COSAG05_NODE_2075_length_3608_cov_4.560274_1_plen_105_part_00
MAFAARSIIKSTFIPNSKGIFEGVEVALKGLHLLRTDAASIAAMGFALSQQERCAILARFTKECDLLRRAQHANIVPFIGVVCDPEPLCLALQYIATGTLHDLL